MNLPPSDFITVSHTGLRDFVARATTTVGMDAERAGQLADLLVANDLRGVFSHGTIQVATYARLMRDGKLNPRPALRTLRDTPVSVQVDGDGGLGYFPAYAAAQAVVEKAQAQGIAVGQSRNHGHFGAAGIYTRLALGHDLLAFVTSGHQLDLKPGQPFVTAAGGSPMSFLAPADAETSLVLDFGAVHDLYVSAPHREEISRLAQGIVLRSVGLGAICQAWGGLLAGVPLDPTRATRTWPGANQGSLIIAFRIDLFMDPAQFKAEMDAYVAAVHRLQPLVGFDRSYLPGGVEAVAAAEYRQNGIPVGRQHQERLAQLAHELGIALPW